MVKFEKVEDIEEENKRKWKIIGSLFIILIIIGGGVSFYLFNKPQDKLLNAGNTLIKKEEAEKPKEESTEQTKTVMFDIKGEINNPGTYKIEEGKRLQDAISISGGLTERADTSLLNLSKKVKDEMVIIIYSKDQVKNIKETVQLEEDLLNKCPSIEENITNSGCIEKENKEPSAETENKNISSKVSLNKATEVELMTLTGIGEAKAKEIIEYREKKGGFTSIEELKEVPGIGESIFAKIKENITL